MNAILNGKFYRHRKFIDVDMQVIFNDTQAGKSIVRWWHQNRNRGYICVDTVVTPTDFTDWKEVL
jgi:hypothetical protein